MHIIANYFVSHNNSGFVEGFKNNSEQTMMSWFRECDSIISMSDFRLNRL